MNYAEPKSATELAYQFKREAYTERRCKPNPVLSDMWERNAADVLTLPMSPAVGPCGEVIDPSPLPKTHAGKVPRRGLEIRNTLAENPTRIAEDASVDRVDLLAQTNLNVVAMGIDAAQSIGAENSLEKMLAHQLAVAHRMTMEFAELSISGFRQTTQ